MAHICRGENIVQFWPSFITNLLQKSEPVARTLVVSIGKHVPLWAKRYSPPLLASYFLLHAARNNGRFALNFEIIQGSFDLFYSLIEFSRHLMSIIQFRTTNTCSSAPKWLEKMYMFPWGPCLGPKEWMGTNSTISPSWLGHKRCESRFLNLCKSKTHQEIMKLGMVSLYGIYNCPISAKLYYKPFTNRSFSQPSWFQ